jgi:ribonuclease HII
MKTMYIDEVGYSSIAGPVLSCAVILEDSEPLFQVKDSKQITKKKREVLYQDLVKIPHAFGTASPKKIKSMNIHWARYESMRIAAERVLKIENANKAIIDGKFIVPNLDIEQEAVIKADEKYWQCSCASILAKVKRDNVMANLAKIEKYSHYKWEKNVGYYTKDHRDGIIKCGPTPLHRTNFAFFQYALYCRQLPKAKALGLVPK